MMNLLVLMWKEFFSSKRSIGKFWKSSKVKLQQYEKDRFLIIIREIKLKFVVNFANLVKEVFGRCGMLPLWKNQSHEARLFNMEIKKRKGKGFQSWDKKKGIKIEEVNVTKIRDEHWT